MDIRNFFGGGSAKKKKTPVASSASSSSAAASSKAKAKSPPKAVKSPPIKSSPAASRKGKANHSDSDATALQEEEDANKKLTPAKTTRAASNTANASKKEPPPESPRRSSPRKRKGPPPNYSAATSNGDVIMAVSGGSRAKRKIVIVDSDEDTDLEQGPNDNDDNDNDDNNNDSDDDDEDFKMNDNHDSEEEEEEFVPEKSSPANHRKRPSSQTNTPTKITKASPKKRAASTTPTRAAKKSTTPTKKSTTPPTSTVVPDSEKPPKYHPHSSLLATKLPFLTTAITLQSTTPKLPSTPKNNPNFSIDQMTPLCLTGLTFVFSGILSTNDEITARTNARVSIGSPSKGDYYKNRHYEVEENNGNNNTGSTELARETATDMIKILGGRVTTAVSGKTDYLVVGNILEDGRPLEEGSKYKKVCDMWEVWRGKYEGDYSNNSKNNNDGDEATTTPTKKKKSAPKKDQDVNTLVEIIKGIDEFYGLIVFMSDWKKGTLSEEERAVLEEEQQQRQQEQEQQQQDRVVKQEKKESLAPVVTSANATANSTTSTTSATAPATNPSSASSIVNPYAKKKVANPYSSASKATATATATPTTPSLAPSSSSSFSATKNNPYAKPVSNPYAKSTSSSATVTPKHNPYAKSSLSSTTNPSSAYADTTTSGTGGGGGGVGASQHFQDAQGKIHINALWADKYAPVSSRDILGNGDSVNKLFKWLASWETTFNNPNRKAKSFSGPNGPWKAALLSGPPGIGKTTTATLVARESNRDVLELNASDARSKKALSEALGDVTGSQVLNFGVAANQSKSKSNKSNPAAAQKRCIIMDEVDGMGAGDRSGMSELIQMIKNSKVPIICICNDRQSQKMRSLTQYCMDLRFRRPVKSVIARRAVEIGGMEGMHVEPNAAEAMAESCGNDIRQVLNCLQMWSCKKKTGGGSASMTYKDLKDRSGVINKDEVLRVSMFDACKSIVEGSRGLAGADAKAVTSSLMKRSDAYFVDYMLMGLNVHQNYLKVSQGQFNEAKKQGDADSELHALDQMHDATLAMSDFGVCEDQLRGGDQNWALLPLCAMLAVKVGHHAGGPNGGFLPGFPEFPGWLGKNSTRNKKIRLLQELRHHMNYKVSADPPELRMNYLPIMREQFTSLLFDKDGAKVTETIGLMDEYGLDRDDVFENLDEFLLTSTGSKEKKFGDLDSKAKAAFTRAYNQVAHKAQALVAEQGAGKTSKKKAGGASSEVPEGAELDVVDDDKAAAQDDDDGDLEEDLEATLSMFKKKGGKRGNSASKAGGKGGAKGAKKK